MKAFRDAPDDGELGFLELKVRASHISKHVPNPEITLLPTAVLWVKKRENLRC